MPGRRTKLRILLSVVALAQILTIPVTGGRTEASHPTTFSNQDNQERVSSLHVPQEAHRKQRIKRASAERRAAEQISMMAHSCKIIARSTA